MINIIRKNQKKLLAVFGVLLMIVFILPSTAKRRSPHQEAMFHIGKEEVTVGEVRAAREQWEEIRRIVPGAAFRLASVAPDLEKNPELFLLLQKEAQQLGLRVTDEQVDQALTQIAAQYASFGRG